MADTAYFIASDGVRIHYAIDDFAPRWKPRDTLVLLHAAMGSMERMYAWVPILSAHYRVVRWDMRGHGYSDIPGEGGLSIERLSRDVAELLDAVGVEQAHLAGSSAGGIVAMHAAITYPQRVRSLGGFASLPGLKSSVGHTDYAGWIRGLTTEGVKPFLKRTIAQRFDLNLVEPGFVEWFLDDAARNDPHYLARYVTMMASVDFTDRLGKISCPSLFVFPGGDPLHTMTQYDVLKRVPQHELLVYDGLPHNITDAVPQRCATDLLQFLLKQPAAR
jgi:pimeloyl-ACP methyl ester carboxylesterase